MCQGRPVRSTPARMPSARRAPSRCVLRVGLGRQHLEHGRLRRRHREGVAEERAADGDHVGALAVGSLRLRQDLGDLVGHAPGAERHSAGDRLAAGHEVGLEVPQRGQAARPDDLRVRLVEGQQRPGLAREPRAGPRGSPASGRIRPKLLVSAGSVEHEGHLVALEGPSQRVGVVEGHDDRLLDDAPGQAPLLGHEVAVGVELDECLVEVAVVVAVEHEHLLAPGHDAGDADRLGVGLRRRQRVLPLRQAVAAAELLGDDDRVFGRAGGTGCRAPCARRRRARAARGRSRRTSTCRRC